MSNVLTWLREVDDRARADTSADRPSTQAITLVAHHRVLYADPDGGNCYPAQTTLAEKCGIGRKTVRAVDAWLIENRLMFFVRNRARGQKEYQLDSDGHVQTHVEGVDNPPDGVAEPHLKPDSDGSAEHHVKSRWVADGSQMGPQEPTTLDLPPVVKGLSSDQREPVDKSPPDDHDVWSQHHPHIAISA